MNPKRDLAYFNLTTVNPALGYEISRSESFELGSTMTVLIRFAINPFHDLVITDAVEIRLYVPTDYHLEGGIRVFTEDRMALDCLRQLSRSSQPADENGTIILPGMDRVKYPFPVWFYAIRNLFQKSTTEPWVCAAQLREEFQHINVSYPKNAVELKLFCGAGRTRGKRNYMEDVDFVYSSIKINDQRSVSVYGVLDGHGGKECSQFCADDIPVRVAANMRNGSSCPEALYKAFLESDQECLESGASGDAGSTANVAVYDQQHNVFYVANAGDTRAVLSRSGVAMDLSFDRKGTDPEEIARVAKAGGFVKNGRLQGSLAVSRALGDLQLKEQGKQNLQRVLIPDPELSAFYPTQRDDFIVIATDGLWDVMTSQAAVDHIHSLLVEEGLLDNGDISALGDDIINMRISQVANNVAVHSVSNLNSMDNVTLLIIILSGGPASCPVQLPARKKFNPRSFSKNVGTGLPLPLPTSSAPRVEEAKGLGEYSSNRTATEKAVDAPLDTHLDEDLFGADSSTLHDQVSTSYMDSFSSRHNPFETTPAPSNSNSHQTTGLNTSAEFDDDMMDFLNDDSNF